MQLFIDVQEMTRVFDQAAGQDRYQLFEHETYELLAALGSESVPEYRVLGRSQRLNAEALLPFFGDRVVIKVISPDVVHKSEVGGVKVVSKQTGKIRSESRRMVDTVSERFARLVETRSDVDLPHYHRLSGRELIQAVNRRIEGILISQFTPPQSDALGNELLVSLRWTREFGMVITAGLGGTDTELFAERFRQGQAVISASCAHVNGEEFFELFTQTIAYKKLSGQARASQRLVSDEQLMECFGAFIAAGNYFSPQNPDAPYVIEELEVNPYALVDYEMVPLDGLCRFCPPFKSPTFRGIERIGKLLHPENLAIIGVSATKANFGRNILNNVIQAGFPKENIRVISPGHEKIEGVSCVEDLAGIGSVDLIIISVGAEQVPGLIEDIIEAQRAQGVILIPGGLGEKEGTQDRARTVIDKIHAAHATPGGGPVFLGGNCMGMISRKGGLDTFFTPDASVPKRMNNPPMPVALISQSGAFALVRMAGLIAGDPAYNISVGNQMDLTIGDFITWFAHSDEVGIISVYAEGFQDLDGLHACRGIREAVRRGKEVIIYKAGRTPEGKKATSGHTASVAGDYMVCTACLSQAGALVTDSLEEFDGLTNLAAYLHTRKISGVRVGALSSAGFECVGIADSLQTRDFGLTLPQFSSKTRAAVSRLFDQARLSDIMDIKNPLDLTSAAPDAVYTGTIKALVADPEIDAVMVSLGSMAPGTSDCPAPKAPEGFVSTAGGLTRQLPEITSKTDKPIVVFNDSGPAHEPISQALRNQGIPVFQYCNQAMALLAQYTAYRLRLDRFRKTQTEKK